MAKNLLEWVKDGDAGTKFFHANATIRHRQNLISSLLDNDGNLVCKHEDKASILWEAYKERLGTSRFTHMYFDLQELLSESENLDWLEEPFLKEEIDKIVQELPLDKSPGPDGFNGEFLKKCWPTVSQDYYELCNGFYEGDICMQSINGSHIVLVPKIDNPTKVGDYRPISLLNSSIKLITKILANRLQQVIPQLIHKNQYGFIRDRSIDDCLAWAFEYLYLCKASRKEMIILKLDFEKAFDMIEHEVILKIMRHKGFGNKWQQWMRIVMTSGTSAILLNGVPGKVFHCRRRVRQGDPLSPLLFVLAADLLQSIINDAMHRGLLSMPLPRCGPDFPIVQYADDTLLIMEACPRQLLTLKALLNSFADSTGLKVNYHKSNIYPINVETGKMENLASTFGCQIGCFPFTYLGLPMGLTKPKVEHFIPLVQRIKRRLVSTSNFLTQADRLEMVNAVLSALPSFYMSKLKLPPSVVRQIDKYRKHCMWRGADLNARKPPMAAWSLATRPKKMGGLGIINLQTQNDALLLKNLHKLFNRVDTPRSILYEIITTAMEDFLIIDPKGPFGGELC
jgi:hypothetical protein